MRFHIKVIFLSLASFYFVYHTINGRHGLIAWLYLKKNIERNEVHLKELEATKNQIAQRVRLLYPDSVSSDLLEERARFLLGFAFKNDCIIVDSD